MQPIDARHFFDCYLVRYSTWAEIVEVMGYSHIWGERCLGRILERVKVEKGETSMAIAGAAVKCIMVWVKHGKLESGSSGHAHGSVVVDDLAEAFRRVMDGKTVHLYFYQDNLARLKAMVEDGSKGA